MTMENIVKFPWIKREAKALSIIEVNAAPRLWRILYESWLIIWNCFTALVSKEAYKFRWNKLKNVGNMFDMESRCWNSAVRILQNEQFDGLGKIFEFYLVILKNFFQHYLSKFWNLRLIFVFFFFKTIFAFNNSILRNFFMNLSTNPKLWKYSH